MLFKLLIDTLVPEELCTLKTVCGLLKQIFVFSCGFNRSIQITGACAKRMSVVNKVTTACSCITKARVIDAGFLAQNNCLQRRLDIHAGPVFAIDANSPGRGHGAMATIFWSTCQPSDDAGRTRAATGEGADWFAVAQVFASRRPWQGTARPDPPRRGTVRHPGLVRAGVFDDRKASSGAWLAGRVRPGFSTAQDLFLKILKWKVFI